MKPPITNRIVWRFAAASVVAGLAVVVHALWPGTLSMLRCADGSVLSIRSVTFGTNHVWFRLSWQAPSSFGQWSSETPSMAIWGVWDGRGHQTHSFRFVTLAEGGYVSSTLRSQMQAFGPGVSAGLLATTTNS